MHVVYVACLFGGFVATLLFAALGAIGGAAGHGAGHLHAAGHAGHLPAPGAAHGAPPAHGLYGAHGTHGATAHGPATGGQAGHGATGGIAHAAAAHAPTVAGRLAATFGWTLSWLSPLTIAAGALWFGGAGLIVEGLLPEPLRGLALLPALVAALAGAALLRTLMAALVRSSTPPLQSDAEGAVGTLSAPIRRDAPGEVIFTLEGLRRSAPARSLDGAPLPRGTGVVIVRRERGMAWVQPLDPLAALPQIEPNEPPMLGDQPSARPEG